MRIAEIHVYQMDLPLSGKVYRMSEGAYTALDSTIVEVVSDTGISGWGEVCPVGPTYAQEHALGARAALNQMAPGLIGRTVTGPREIRRAMATLLYGHDYAKAAIDIAMHDLIGKAHGIRVCDMLGGAASERVNSYYALPIGDPDEVARTAVERIAEGYPRLQIKVGGRPVEIDIETIRKVWEATGCTRLSVDANRSLNTRDVLRIGRECADIPFVFEQPCNTMEEIAAIRGQLHHGIYLDENTEGLNDVLRAISLGVCDGFGLKVTRFGGLGGIATVRDLCESRSMPHTCDDSWGGDIIAAACVHIGATVQPRLLEGVWLAEPFMDVHYDSDNPIRVEGGHIQVPTGPGLGVVPDEGVFGKPVASFA
ncbi:mandelate racemase [Streptomyces sp. BV286]|uniref:mandelate racemase/muconate lactonizing enzyme family protein n=1 Tax=Streptomyces sp. BV286 TaxID=2849672 RepID=UPI001C2E9A50|nr:enolase C-terminal domain-like protein [Streptomyces sp. BV286]MBV1935601.1 mandelate racemase [Streptomyces sp. BV286]